MIVFGYDKLGRMTFKNLPGIEPDVTLGYDNLGRLTSLSQSGNALGFGYDALGRNLTQSGPEGTFCSSWDLAGRRTRLTYAGGCVTPTLYMNYDYLVTGEMTRIRENGATSGIGVLATYAYDNLGRRSSLTFGNGTSQTFTYDAISRLNSLTVNLEGAGTANDLTVTNTSYNPAGQIYSQTRSNEEYAWTGSKPIIRPYLSNGLNQLTQSGNVSLTYTDNVGSPGTELEFAL